MKGPRRNKTKTELLSSRINRAQKFVRAKIDSYLRGRRLSKLTKMRKRYFEKQDYNYLVRIPWSNNPGNTE